MTKRTSHFPCPAGHESTQPDYCSKCGAKLGVAEVPGESGEMALPLFLRKPAKLASARPPPAAAQIVPPPAAAPIAPVPAAAAVASAPAAAPVAPAPAEPAPADPPAAIAVKPQELWVSVRVDPTLVLTPDPDNPCPVDTPEKLFPLDLAKTLVGRRSHDQDVHQEIPIADSGISRRHLTFLRAADSRVTVLDLNSTNGTKLNGMKLEAGVETLVRPGDELTIGEWTRLIIRTR